MFTVTDLPQELLSAIIIETARIWPHVLWPNPVNKFPRLEDDCFEVEPPLHSFRDCLVALMSRVHCDYCVSGMAVLGFVTLTHVSRTFRAVTLATPNLWTTVDDEQDAGTALDCLETFLIRSQSLPLT